VKAEVKNMKIELLKTTYYRGRGPLRIKRVFLLTTDVNAQAAPRDSYVQGVGLMDGSGLAPALPNLNKFIGGPIRNAIVRISDPKWRPIGSRIPEWNSTTLLGMVVLDLASFDPETKEIAVKGYGFDGSALIESESIVAPNFLQGFEVLVEVEYTSFSGAEG
jgi:hypothetical protein